MHIPPFLIPFAVSIIVYLDARAIGVKKGLLPGFFNMGAGMWALACFLFLILALPAYLLKRGDYKRANAELKMQALLPPQEPEPGVWPPPPQVPPAAP